MYKALKSVFLFIFLVSLLIISGSLTGSNKTTLKNINGEMAPGLSIPGDTAISVAAAEDLPVPGITLGAATSGVTAVGKDSVNEDVVTADEAAGRLIMEAEMLYDSLDLKNVGLGEAAFEYAWKGYQYLLKKNKLSRENILTICDFSQSSRKKRLYIIDVEARKLILNTYVAHGRKSGGEYARYFSNTPRSNKSSLGFYVTRKTYYGDHGLALKINGLEKGFNDLAGARNIVIHGSHYVGADFLQNNPFNGRSLGCPAIPAKLSPKVINAIKGGSCLFIYHPSEKYLTHSKILNG